MFEARYAAMAAVSILLAVTAPALADNAPASPTPASSVSVPANSASTNPAPAQPAPPAPPTSALGSPLFDSGKLLATGGVSNLEGVGGGGLANWALITGYGTDNAVGTSVHGTYIYLPNYTIRSAGAGIGFFDRVEVTYSRLWFDTGSTGSSLGLGKGFTFREDVIGAKVKVLGDAIYDQTSWKPQIAVGTEYKMNNQAAILHAIGARHADGTDFYVAATKLFLSQSLLLDATVRETKANQFGILGFGGPNGDRYSPEFEGTAAYMLARDLVIGAEFRSKPNNLGFTREDDSADAFLAYFFNKHLSATLAFVALGDIATKRDQNGVYVSVQSGF
jgi:hypothetical protein